MLRRRAGFLALVAALVRFSGDQPSAHAGLLLSDPVEGATLGETPTAVRLSFSEKPEVSLSEIRVLDTNGAAYQISRPELFADDPLSLSVRVRPLERGVYTVSWRIVSAVDGHATTGAYAFGVRTAPTAAAQSANATASRLEMLARWFVIVGLVALLGAASASVGRFGGKSDAALGAFGWCLAFLGVVLLAVAQARNASASFTVLLTTSVGRFLIGRATAIGIAGVALVLSRSSRWRAGSMAVVGLAALAAMGAHAAAGHAAAPGNWPTLATVGAQWAHFAAVGIWLGGLAAVLLGMRGASPSTKVAAIRRFSSIAAAGLLVVVATGFARTIGELSSWRDLISTAYGQAVSVKIALTGGIAAFGAYNRWWSVPGALTSLRRLRQAGSGELALAVAALAAAAVLGTLPPPAAALRTPLGLSAAGADYGTTVRVRLTTASNQPGPNRFTVHAVDYDTKQPVQASRVSLRFTPLDDPAAAPTMLHLSPDARGSYVGSGANLAFDGRWRVAIVIERADDSVEVPLDIETRSPVQFVSIQRIPGQAPSYTIEIKGAGQVRITPDPERAGRSHVYVTCFDLIGDEWPVDEMVVTMAAGSGPARQQPVRRLARTRFVSDVEFQPGSNRITVVARTINGTRLRAAVDLDIGASH